MRRGPRFAVASFLALLLAVSFLTFPVVAVFTDSSPSALISSLGEPQARDALLLSLQTSFTALVVIVVVGTPAAYLLATRNFAGRALVQTLVELPIVMPPAVAGIGLLAAFGPKGILGETLDSNGVELAFQTSGVVVALTFVAAPFYIRQAQAAFAAVDPDQIDASRTLGAGEARTFMFVAVPAARLGISAGLALSWGRALGEFGATLMFAGSFQGITQTAPLAIFARFGRDFDSALALSAVLIAISAALLITVKLVAGADAMADRGR